MTSTRHPLCPAITLAIVIHSATPAVATQDRAARDLMASRSPRQQAFLIEHRQSHPLAGTSTDAQLRWMDEAERAFVASLRGKSPPGADRGGRAESFSPYVWSWLPMFVTDGTPGEELSRRTQVERVLPTLLVDLETVVDEREPGACELLRIPDLGNGLARADLLVRADQAVLDRCHAAIDKLPSIVADWQAASGEQAPSVPKHLRAAIPQLRRFASLIDIERDLRANRLEPAHARIASMATPGRLPSGFRAMVERLARKYRAAERFDAALAVLDLGLLSTTEGDWPMRALRPLYDECGGRSASQRFELAQMRRAPSLVPSTLRFDPSALVDIESGQPFDTRLLNGKTLVLDYMIRGCGPCLMAVPKLQAFDADHPGIVVLAVVVGTSEDRAIVRDAVRERGGRFPLVADTAGLAEKLQISGYPSYVVVSANGLVLKPFGMRREPTHSFNDVVGTLAPDSWQLERKAR